MDNVALNVDKHKSAALADTLIRVAVGSRENITDVFAATQLATLSLAGMILAVATATENLEHNKASLVEIVRATADNIENFTAEDLTRITDLFEDATNPVTGVH